jgi:hypothetical protein
LPDQPIFYPVASAEYATQIARDWNTRSLTFAGYVTSFEVQDDYLAKFERHIVGSAVHEEYWIPASQLTEFNQAILGQIEVDVAFFGESFVGFVPEKFGLREKCRGTVRHLGARLGLQPNGLHLGDFGQSESRLFELPILGGT